MIRLRVQFDQNISFTYTVVVIHQDPGNLAADAGGNERQVAVHVCIVRRNGVDRQADRWNAENNEDGYDYSACSSDQQLSPSRGRSTFRSRWPGTGMCLC